MAATTAGEVMFVDTNVLLAATDESRRANRDARRLFTESTRLGLHLGASGQILREYLVVATRPVEANGLGLNALDATANVSEFLQYVHVYDETEAVAGRLRELASLHSLRGKRIHDANIVATMATHGTRALITENGEDFRAFGEIEVVELAGVTSES